MLEWLLKKTVMALGVLVVASLALYAGDWAIWKLRHSAMGQVERTSMDAASLKGNKTEYYYNGKYMADCSRTLFPQAGEGSCWWLERHRVSIHEY